MKKVGILRRAALMLAVVIMIPVFILAQENEKSSPFDVGGDLVSSYVWRGTKFGSGPAIQPYVELALGNFAVGAWGNYNFTSNEAAEADLYISYGFNFGLSIGFTDYYFPGSEYFKYESSSDSTGGSHGLELNLGYEIKGFSVGANYIFNSAPTAGTSGGDMYFELGYSFNSLGILVGGGDGWHTSDGEFGICNIGITASKEIQFTEKFALPVNGAIILNPERQQFNVVVGVSF